MCWHEWTESLTITYNQGLFLPSAYTFYSIKKCLKHNIFSERFSVFLLLHLPFFIVLLTKVCSVLSLQSWRLTISAWVFVELFLLVFCFLCVFFSFIDLCSKYTIKGPLSRVRQLLVTESPWCFLFHVKSSFRSCILKIFKFLSWLFVIWENGLIRKLRLTL